MMRSLALRGGAILLLLAGLGIARARAEGPDPAREELFAALRESICVGYDEKNATRILSAYDPAAKVATFTAGVLDKEQFAALIAADLAQYEKIGAALEISEAVVNADDAKVALRMTLSGVLTGGEQKVRTDRLYFVLRRQGAWRILLQTYRKDYTLPTLPPMKVH